MCGASPNSGSAFVRCREMADGDREAVVALLTRGFAAWRDAAFWAQALRRLAERTPPDGLPQFGYVLEAAGAVVGVLLVIASRVPGGADTVLRCNVSSWYVEPAFRLYGALLVRRALRRADVTALNVTPAPETRALLAAQGYVQYAAGRAIGVPLLSRWRRGRAVIAGPGLEPGPDLSAAEVELLADHARWGCICLVSTIGGARSPFVFGLRRRHNILPFAYLIYGRSLDELSAHASPIGRVLLRFGVTLVVADADAALRGMPGRFQPGFPKFYRGAHPPAAGDLAYTERAVFGV